MTRFDAPSRCSSGSAVTFHWFGTSNPASDATALDAATKRFVDAISGPGRLWNPYSLALAKVEFGDRVQQAAAGKLVPVDEVKPVDVKNSPPLYELRWQGIDVVERDDDSPAGKRFLTVLVRMYHSEPSTRPGFFIGHHIHEKVVTGADPNADQNVEIAEARRIYFDGVSSAWGLPAPG
ncbi:hypothetical protein [Rathayibacter rathayi]|uniref:hypothetical protein n=1 Tax=Rathayibacter rathayi TaxID=33887 RepID=UPI000CE7CA79|nr:hypothetical protein [Rathayibacter rathayi]PPG85007.1 hypothetical protein C5C47_14090 [Rathayibacter rathayi]